MTPILQDAMRRAPVRVVRDGRPTVVGELVAIGGGRHRAVGAGRAKVRLSSGRFVSVPLWTVEVIG